LEALDTLIALLNGALIEGSGMPDYRGPSDPTAGNIRTPLAVR
jgi:hypothetical protein